MAYCKKCGAEIQEGVAFCTQCGTKVAGDTQQSVTKSPQNSPSSSTNVNVGVDTNKSNKIVGIVAAAAIALFALFILGKVFGAITTPGYEKPLKYLEQGYEDGDFKKLMKAYPSFYKEQFEEVMSYIDDEDDYMNILTDRLKESFGRNYKITISVKDKEKLDKDELEDIEDSIKSQFDEKVKVKAGYSLEVEMKIKGSKDKNTDKNTFEVIKIGSKWYLNDFSLDF